jgi:hypothetical protein
MLVGSAVVCPETSDGCTVATPRVACSGRQDIGSKSTDSLADRESSRAGFSGGCKDAEETERAAVGAEEDGGLSYPVGFSCRERTRTPGKLLLRARTDREPCRLFAPLGVLHPCASLLVRTKLSRPAIPLVQKIVQASKGSLYRPVTLSSSSL